MRLTDFGTVPLTLIASLLVTIILLAIRIFVMQRVQTKRQRENRQETERLRSLVAAYRSLAGSFSPAADADRAQLEEVLGDIVLFGSLRQVELAAQCATSLVRGEPVDYQVLVEDLRSDLRRQLGLEVIPATLRLPPSGPGRPARADRSEAGARRGGNAGAAGGGGGAGGGAAAGAGGVGIGVIASEAGAEHPPL
jgi:hypothetical protein